jgi:hypothetical protein
MRSSWGSGRASVGRRSVRADRDGHPRAGRAAPQGVPVGADTERLCMAKDVGDRRRQVPGGDLLTMPCPVPQHESGVALAGDRRGMRKAFVNGADVGEPAARGDDREGRAGASAEEEEAGVLPGRLLLRFGFGMETVEHRPAASRLVGHAIQRARDRLRVDVAVVGQQRADAGQGHLLVVGPIVARQQQSAESSERRVMQHVSEGAPSCQVAAPLPAHVGVPDPMRRLGLGPSVEHAAEQREYQGGCRRDRGLDARPGLPRRCPRARRA